MGYTIESIARDVIKITAASDDVLLTPVKILPTSYIEEAADISISPSVTPSSNVYTLNGGQFEITFNEDGIYKLYITETLVEYIHYVYITNEVDDYFEENIPLLIVPNPQGDYLQDPDHRTYYDFNVITMLTLGFFGETNENVFLNYKTINSGVLYEGQIYQCLSVGSGTYNWQDSNGDDLLMDMSGNYVTNTSSLVLNAYYKCVKTGTPVDYGGTTESELTLNSDIFYTRLLYIVDSLYRFNKYINDCIDSNY